MSAYEGGGAAAAWESHGPGPAGRPGTVAGPQPDLHVPGYAAPDEHTYAHPGLTGDGYAPAGGHGDARFGASAQAPALSPHRLPGEPVGPDDELPGSDTPSVLGPPSLAPTLHRGRAARRRQMARWKKNRRRAAAATAVALFGGGVTVASMQGHSGRSGSTTAAADPQAPTALQTGNTSVSAPDGQTAPSAAPTTHAAPQQHRTAARPAPHSTHAGPDSITSIPSTVIPSGHPVTYSGSTRPAPTTTTAPPAPTSTGGTTTTSGGSSSGTSTTATTPPATPPADTPPATTAPSTPPQQQLCLLIICLG